MNIDWIALIGYIIAPISGVASWLAGRRKSNNDFLRDMQESIDLLVEKNKVLIKEITELRDENSKLISQVKALSNDNIQMRREVEHLSGKIRNLKSTKKQ